MAEWLGSALQKLLQRFESASDLQQIRKVLIFVFCFFYFFFQIRQNHRGEDKKYSNSIWHNTSCLDKPKKQLKKCVSTC